MKKGFAHKTISLSIQQANGSLLTSRVTSALPSTLSRSIYTSSPVMRALGVGQGIAGPEARSTPGQFSKNPPKIDYSGKENRNTRLQQQQASLGQPGAEPTPPVNDADISSDPRLPFFARVSAYFGSRPGFFMIWLGNAIAGLFALYYCVGTFVICSKFIFLVYLSL